MGNSTSLSVGSQVNSGPTLYTIDKLLGQGGFGITYKVTGIFKHGKIEQRGCFAMKEHFVGDFCERDHATGCVRFSAPVKDKVEESLSDFIAEARRLNSLDHPNIVAVNEVFEANYTAYYVMEYIEGKSLRDYIIANGPLAEREALTVMTPILNAVEYLHVHRMTHLDIKPDNIMLKPATEGDFTPILIDFGLSKHYDEKGRPTSTIRIQGCSAGYAPMEQYVGIESFTPQADVYALGATMLYLLTGCQPEVASAQNSNKILSSLPAAVSDKVRQAIVRAMQPNKDNRTQSVADFARDLGIELTGTAASTISASSLTQQLKKKKKPKKPNKPGGTEYIDPNKSSSKRWVTPLLIGLGVLVVGVIAFFAFNAISDNDPIDSADSTDSTTVPTDTVADPTEQPGEALDAPAVVDEEKVAAAELERQYRSDYSSAEQLYNQEKYSECKSRCQSMLNSYPSHRGEINALISKCDSAIRLPKTIDLGLPSGTLWADRNVGASSPSDYGGYYAWGETSTKDIYTWDTYQYFHDQDGNGVPWDINNHYLPQANELTDIGSDITGTRYDVARQKWGGDWKMPTKSQWKELLNNCTWTWTTLNDVIGYKVTSKKNGNYIFLPAAGFKKESSVEVGECCSYMSSMRDNVQTYNTWPLSHDSRSQHTHTFFCCYGFQVRPVCNK